ncbi:MAG TPA: phosphotransferase [Actinomycetota bacterium]|nr:phosphotransferase [Actinomycetota bacterium]
MAAIEQPETDPVRQLLRRRPPAAALGWAAAPFGPGSRVVSVRPLPSAWLANHVVEVADAAGAVHPVVLRRWARPGWDEEDPDFTAAREAAILDLLAPTPVPAPALLAADPGATVCDVPALLLALLPGGPPDLRGDPGRLVEGLAAALPPIHAVAVPRAEGTPGAPGSANGPGPRVVPDHHRFYDPARLDPPAWSPRPGLWRRAFEVAAGPSPDDHACFIHRDYHPANTLWTGGRLTGVVDWIGGSWGPPSVDLGHMRVNLAADLGLEVADRFLAAHRALTGFEHHPWWDVASAVDVTPEAPGSWDGVEDLIAAALARLGG